MKLLFLSLFSGTILLSKTSVESFVSRSTTAPPTPSLRSASHAASLLVVSSSTTDGASTEAETDTAYNGLLKRDRYIASNRFSVRAGREAKFEKRWATRKSRLAQLDGFRYFHLMRRVTLNDKDDPVVATNYDGGDDKESSEGNYVSFTVWDTKKDFSAWRKGDAFKEAHGGTSIGAFVSTMVSSAMVLRGPPRPAFYDGLLVQSEKPESVPETVDGWRNVVFPEDGSTLPVECFVACNQFFVPRDNAAAFEQRWKNRESKLKDCEGFVSFSVMRRDGQAKGHGTVELDESVEPTYVSTTIWKDRASFDKWRSGSNFSKSHGQQKAEAVDAKDESEEAAKKPPPRAQGPPQWSRPPQPVFYEGTLVITTADGA